jgi:hypothetical protein
MISASAEAASRNANNVRRNGYTSPHPHQNSTGHGLPDNLVARPRLLEYLNTRRQRPLTAVVAPAGYGKTTLVSSWLEDKEDLGHRARAGLLLVTPGRIHHLGGVPERHQTGHRVARLCREAGRCGRLAAGGGNFDLAGATPVCGWGWQLTPIRTATPDTPPSRPAASHRVERPL